jgi:hypothetical protein
LPLLHGFDSSLRQNWVASDDCKVSDLALLIDDDSKNHVSDQVLLFGFNGLLWPFVLVILFRATSGEIRSLFTGAGLGEGIREEVFVCRTNLKGTDTTVVTSTGLPFSRYGLNIHCFTACIAASLILASTLGIGVTLDVFPCLSMTTRHSTSPKAPLFLSSPG